MKQRRIIFFDRKQFGEPTIAESICLYSCFSTRMVFQSTQLTFEISRDTFLLAALLLVLYGYIRVVNSGCIKIAELPVSYLDLFT